MEKTEDELDAQKQQDSLITPTRMEQEKEMLVEPLKISESVEEENGGAVQHGGNGQFQATTKYLAIGGNAEMDEIHEHDEIQGSLPATESTARRTPPSDATSTIAVDQKDILVLDASKGGECPEKTTEDPSSSIPLKMEDEKPQSQNTMQSSIPSSPEVNSPVAKKSKTEKSNCQEKSQPGSKKISKTIRRGRHGDPRMHRAVAARLLNPEMNLLESLLEGGFTFPNGAPSDAENVDKSDRDIHDSDGILLSQRKNQLSRRLRLAKKRQLVSRPEEPPDPTAGLVPPGMRLPQLPGSEISNNTSDDRGASRELQNMLLNGRIAATTKPIRNPDPQFRNFYPEAPGGDAFAFQNMILNGGAPTSMPFQNTSGEMPMLNPTSHQLNASALNNPAVAAAAGPPGGIHQREGESRQQQHNFLQSQGHMPGNAGSNPASAMFHHQQNLRGTFFPNQDRTARDDNTSVANNQPFGQEGNGWFPSQQSAQRSQQGMLPPAGSLDPQQLLQLSSMMSMGLQGNQIPNNPNMGAPSFQGGSMPARGPNNNFPPFEMNRAQQHFLSSTVDFSGRGTLGHPHSTNKTNLNDGVTNNMIGIQQQQQQQEQQQQQPIMEAADEAQEKRSSSHQKTSNMWG